MDFRSPVAGLGKKSRGVGRIPGNSFERKCRCKTGAILLSSTSFTHRKLWLHDVDEKRGCQSERRQLFAGQAPRVSSPNIPVFHPDQLQMVSNNMIPQYHLHFPRTMRLHLDLNATPAANSSEDFVADFRGSESSLQVQSASTYGEVIAVAPLSESDLQLHLASTHREVVAVAPLLESDLELHLASTHREDVVACSGINSVAVRNFVIQLHEEAASESSLELQLAYIERFQSPRASI